MDKKSLLNEALNMSKWEKIDSGIHNFVVKSVENRLTDKSKRDAIVYSGVIKNSRGLEQVVNVVDLIDNDEGFKFGVSRLIQFINYFGDVVENVDGIDELINIANKNVGKVIKLEFVKKIVNGITIKDKLFVFNK